MNPYVQLARLSIEKHTLKQALVIPKDIREALQHQHAAVFVSIHKQHELRGCIGTLEPVYESILDEIQNNAISACSRDPRFAPVSESELSQLEINVDILSPLEIVASKSDLDAKRYGVLVTAPDGRRGVLLPDLEGVRSVDQQIEIACKKGGIRTSETFEMKRFTVTRHR